jgi:hypothetical protein
MLKAIFKGAAQNVESMTKHPLHADYKRMLGDGMKPTLARITIARKIAAAVLAMWKKGGVRPGQESAQASRSVGSVLRGVNARDDSARRRSAAVSRESIHLICGRLHAESRPLVSGYAPSEHLLGAMADRGPARRMVPASFRGTPKTAPPCHQHRTNREHHHAAPLSAAGSSPRDPASTETRPHREPASRPLDVTGSSDMATCALTSPPLGESEPTAHHSRSGATRSWSRAF